MWTIGAPLLIRPLRTHVYEICLKMKIIFIKKNVFRNVVCMWTPFCLGLNVLKLWQFIQMYNVDFDFTITSVFHYVLININNNASFFVKQSCTLCQTQGFDSIKSRLKHTSTAPCWDNILTSGFMLSLNIGSNIVSKHPTAYVTTSMTVTTPGRQACQSWGRVKI